MNVGFKRLTIEDGAISFPSFVFYPTCAEGKSTAFGPYSMDVAPDADIIQGRFPLVVISHGSGGTPLVYRTLAAHLVKQGYVVAAPEHYGNNRIDNSLDGKIENLQYRPRHVKLMIDAVLTAPSLGTGVDEKKIAMIGHSMGGFTALAIAGGRPWEAAGKPVAVESDSRVRALVLLAPAAGWYNAEGALDAVRIPILVMMAEHDPITPQWNADIIVNRVSNRDLVRVETVRNAGHFSFLSPFPPAMKTPGFLPATDPHAFDRDVFHVRFYQDVSNFLSENLAHT